MRFGPWLTPRVSNIPHKRIGVYAAGVGSAARIESLSSFQLAFIEEYAVRGKPFDAGAFETRVNEGDTKFQHAIVDEKLTRRRSILNDLVAQFKADAARLRSKATRSKVTPALAIEMKDINKIYDHALGGRTSNNT